MAAADRPIRPGDPVVLLHAEPEAPLAQAVAGALYQRHVRIACGHIPEATLERLRIIVLCSSAMARKVEISEQLSGFFQRGGARSAVLAVVVEGKADPQNLACCVPGVLLSERGGDGLLRSVPAPTILDLRHSADPVADILERLGLARSNAGISARLENLIRRRPVLSAGALGASALVLAGVSGLVLIDRSQAESRAQVSQTLSRNVLNFLMSEGAAVLPTDALEDLAEQTAAYLDSEAGRSASPQDWAALGRLWLILGENYDQIGEFDLAQEMFQRAYALTVERTEAEPDNLEALHLRARAAGWMARSHTRAMRPAAARPFSLEYGALTERLLAEAPDEPVYVHTRIAALTNIGAVWAAEDRAERALEAFTEVVTLHERQAAAGDVSGAPAAAAAYGWIAEIHTKALRFNEALEAINAETEIYRTRFSEEPGDRWAQFTLSGSLRSLAYAQSEMGRLEEAEQAAAEAFGLARDLFFSTDRVVRDAFAYSRAAASLIQVRLAQRRYGEAHDLIVQTRADLADADLLTADTDRFADRARLAIEASRWALQTGALDEALGEAARAQSLLPPEAEEEHQLMRFIRAQTYYVAGAALAAQGETGCAEENFTQALRLLAEPDRAAAMDLQARLFWRLNLRADALSLRERLIDAGYADPFFEDFWRNALPRQAERAPN